MTNQTPLHPPVSLTLSDSEALTIHRALVDYRRILSWSAMRVEGAGDDVVSAEMARVDAVAERLSLLVYFPERIFGRDEAA